MHYIVNHTLINQREYGINEEATCQIFCDIFRRNLQNKWQTELLQVMKTGHLKKENQEVLPHVKTLSSRIQLL